MIEPLHIVAMRLFKVMKKIHKNRMSILQNSVRIWRVSAVYDVSNKKKINELYANNRWQHASISIKDSSFPNEKCVRIIICLYKWTS